MLDDISSAPAMLSDGKAGRKRTNLKLSLLHAPELVVNHNLHQVTFVQKVHCHMQRGSMQIAQLTGRQMSIRVAMVH